MYRSAPPSDRSAGDSECPPQRRRPEPCRLRRRRVLGGVATQTLLRGLAQEIRVMASGDLLMRLRKHSTHKTARRSILFPE
jgi:hypothetical protein